MAAADRTVYAAEAEHRTAKSRPIISRSGPVINAILHETPDDRAGSPGHFCLCASAHGGQSSALSKSGEDPLTAGMPGLRASFLYILLTILLIYGII